MTVIVKELIVKTTLIEDLNTGPSINVVGLKNDIIKDCIHKLKKTLKQQKSER